jgi:hypothetical protein
LRERSFLVPILLLLYGGWIFGLHPGQAHACSCLQPPPPDEALRQADAVFAGEVTDFRIPAPGNRATRFDRYEATFRVTAVWKGPDSDRIKVLTADPSQEMCGYRFEPGIRYLVYAIEMPEGLGTSTCSRTAVLDAAGYDLAALGEGTPPPSARRNVWLMRDGIVFVVLAASLPVWLLLRQSRRKQEER